MASKSLAPPERNTLPAEEPKCPIGLLGSRENIEEYGQQLSSFTKLKQSKKTGTLFAITDSPLKTD